LIQISLHLEWVNLFRSETSKNTSIVSIAYARYQAKKFEHFKNSFKFKPASSDVHEKNENASFLDSTCVLPFHAQEVNLEYRYEFEKDRLWWLPQIHGQVE